MPDAYYYTYCDLWEVNPSKETCEAQPGCKEEWGYCNCKTRAGCDALGGYFWGEKCGSDLQRTSLASGRRFFLGLVADGEKVAAADLVELPEVLLL